MGQPFNWFATSIVGPHDLNNPTWEGRADATMMHAKRVGTCLTACGRDASTWHKHWLPFDPYGGNGCPDCIEVLRNASLVADGRR
jgi:hypothetical protein